MFEAYSHSNREGLIAASRIEKEARSGSKAVDRDRTQGLPVHFGEPRFSKVIQTVSDGSSTETPPSPVEQGMWRRRIS